MPLDEEAPLPELIERSLGDIALNLCVIGAGMAVFRIEEKGIEARLIREEEEPLAVEVEPSERVDTLGEAARGQSELTVAVLGELREHSVGLVESEEHLGGRSFPFGRPPCKRDGEIRNRKQPAGLTLGVGSCKESGSFLALSLVDLMKVSPLFLRAVFLAMVCLGCSREGLVAQGNKNQGTVAVTFTNATERKVVLHSSAPGQALQPFGEVEPGQSAKVRSLPGQRWVFMNVNSKVFGEYHANNERQQAFRIVQASGGGNAPGAPAKPNQGNPNQTGNKGANSQVAGNTGSRLSPQQVQQILDYHNQKRGEVGNGKVAWSAQIAKFAQQRADQIAREKRLAHLPQGQNPYGENLAQGGASGGVSGYTVVNACEGWYAERAKMQKNARTMSVELFNRGVGHYTQMVWKGTTQIGAGISTYQQGGFTMTVVVCCYNPPGNVLGGVIY